MVARIADDGYSGTDPPRPGLLEVLRLAQEGKIDAALATKRDRFYRSRLLRLATDQDLEDHGVRLFALDDTGHMVADAMLDSFAEYERTIIRDRLMDAKRRKARNGEIPGVVTRHTGSLGRSTITANKRDLSPTRTCPPCGRSSRWLPLVRPSTR